MGRLAAHGAPESRLRGLQAAGHVETELLGAAWSPDALAASDGGIRAVIKGRIDNREELARLADLDPQAPQAALVAAAYRLRGESILETLRGSFVLLAWDGSNGLVAVDPLGAAGLFHAAEDGAFLFASEIRDLLRLLRRAPGPSVGALARFVLDGALAPAETTYAGVRRLEGGHAVRFTAEGWEEYRYWALSYRRPRPWTLQEASLAVRDAVEAAVRRRVDPGGQAGILLSGGLDSGSVASMAARSKLPVRAYSAVFPEHPSTDESALIKAVTSQLRLPSRLVAFDGGGMLRALLTYVQAWRIPAVSPNLFFQLPLLDVAQREGLVVMLDGQGGDELFGASPFLAADRLRRGRAVAARRLGRAFDGPDSLGRHGLKGALPWWAHALRRRFVPSPAPRLLTTRAAEAHQDQDDPWRWKLRDGPRWWAFASDLLTSQRERTGAHDFLRHKFALAHVEGRHPFLAEAELIELALSLPPELAFTGALDRPVLRAALKDVLPDEVRSRPDKAFFDPVFLQALAEERGHIERLLGRGAEVHAIARPEIVERSILGLPDAARGPAWAWQTWRLLAAEVFLRTQADEDFPARALERWHLSVPRFAD